MSMPGSSAGRNPWPWAIGLFFVLFIGGVISFIAFAMHQDMDLVREDYYAEELRHQERIEALTRAEGLGPAASLALLPGGHRVELRLPASQVAAGVRGSLEFYRPSNKSMDRLYPLTLGPGGVLRLDVSGLSAGQWLVRADWTVGAQRYLKEVRVVLAGAALTAGGPR